MVKRRRSSDSDNPPPKKYKPTSKRPELTEKERRNAISELYQAIVENDFEIVEFHLKSLSANVPSELTLFTPLQLAILHNHPRIVKLLLRHGANVNLDFETLRNIINIKPLQIAIVDENIEIMQLLLDHGADVDCKTYDNHCALYYALSCENTEIARLLLQRGANVENKNNLNVTPLQRAIDLDKKDMVKLLLNFGADVNARNSDLTPLQFSVKENRKDITDFLLRHVIERKCLGFYVCAENLNCLDENMNDEFRKYEACCMREAEDMKREIIEDKSVTLHKIVTKKLNQVVLYLRDENVRTKLLAMDDRNMFPIYWNRINKRLLHAFKDHELYVKRFDAIFEILNAVKKLPIECIEKIVSFLDDEDLKLLFCTNTNTNK